MGVIVMVVDDSSTIRKIVTRCLKAADMDITEVYEAKDGQEALELMSQRRIDVVLTDINTPKMDDIQLLEQIKSRREWEAIRVMMISSESSAVSVHEAIRKGAAGFIRKPFTSAEINAQFVPVLGTRFRQCS